MSNRISARLKKIEQQTAQQGASSNKMLVELLARRDALFYPWRVWSLNSGLIHFEMQRECHAGRRGFSAKASGVVDWQSASEQRSLLIDRGLATPMRSAGGEINALCLTPLGDATGRALVGPRLHQLGGQLPRMITPHVRHVRRLRPVDGWQVDVGKFALATPATWRSDRLGTLGRCSATPDHRRAREGGLRQTWTRLLLASALGQEWRSTNSTDRAARGCRRSRPEDGRAYLSAYKSSGPKLEPSHELHIGIPASSFHAFMVETDAQPKSSESDDDIRRREHFHAVLERRSYDTDLQTVISRLETFLATVGV